VVRAGKGFKWTRNADGIYYRSFAFCEDEDCPDEGRGWIGKMPDLMVGGGLVRGSHFYECVTCDRKWYFSEAEREWRMECVFEAQRVDRVENGVRGWVLYSYGTMVGFYYAEGHDPLRVSVVGYLREPRLGYALTGIVRVRVAERARTDYSEGSVIDVGVSNLVSDPLDF
jgi:hypothetical protein